MNRARSLVTVGDPGRLAAAGLAAVVVTIQAGLWLSGGATALPDIYRRFGLSRDGLEEGKIWQLESYALLHGGWVHTLTNILGLVFLVPQVQRILGSRLVAAGLMGGVLAGGVAHVMVSRHEVLVGISGGLSSLMLLLTTLAPEARVRGLRISAGNLGRGFLIASAALMMISPQTGIPGLERVGRWMDERGGSSVFQIAHACHLGGGVFGWMLARWILRPRADLKKLRAARARREGGP
ncbi:rhomboid family intramembrane serine protease [Haloferula sargassicola]|uniref:Peptidase S54 rhomboid domain-containing protein n=1 Tax=Haloferula sargassicola TaxID=490096 RepID=A0ABP9UL03_9BACT